MKGGQAKDNGAVSSKNSLHQRVNIIKEDAMDEENSPLNLLPPRVEEVEKGVKEPELGGLIVDWNDEGRISSYFKSSTDNFVDRVFEESRNSAAVLGVGSARHELRGKQQADDLLGKLSTDDFCQKESSRESEGSSESQEITPPKGKSKSGPPHQTFCSEDASQAPEHHSETD